MAYRIRTRSEEAAKAMASDAVGRGLFLRSWKDRAGFWTLEVRKLADAERLKDAVPSGEPEPRAVPVMDYKKGGESYA